MSIGGISRYSEGGAMMDPQLDKIFANLRDLSGRVANFSSTEPASHVILEALSLASGVTQHLRATAEHAPQHVFTRRLR
jgi:uncharacterized Fe-S radical SAM superfamily protein PflX